MTLKSSPLKKKGKKTRAWEKARKELKWLFLNKNITTCEVGWEGCTHNDFLSFHHRHKRSFYDTHPDLLGEFSQVLLLCTSCHHLLEYDKVLSDAKFEQFRGDEKLDPDK